MTDRKRRTTEVSDLTCDICGAAGLEIVESRSTRSGMDLVNPAWRASRRTYQRCRACGVKYPLQGGRRI